MDIQPEIPYSHKPLWFSLPTFQFLHRKTIPHPPFPSDFSFLFFLVLIKADHYKIFLYLPQQRLKSLKHSLRNSAGELHCASKVQRHNFYQKVSAPMQRYFVVPNGELSDHHLKCNKGIIPHKSH